MVTYLHEEVILQNGVNSKLGPTVHKHVVLRRFLSERKIAVAFMSLLKKAAGSVALLVAEDFVIDGGFAQHGVVATRVRARLAVGVLLVGVDVVRLVVIVVAFLDHVDFADKLGAKLKENAFAVGTPSILLKLFAHGFDGIANFEGRAQFDLHG